MTKAQNDLSWWFFFGILLLAFVLCFVHLRSKHRDSVCCLLYCKLHSLFALICTVFRCCAYCQLKNRNNNRNQSTGSQKNVKKNRDEQIKSERSKRICTRKLQNFNCIRRSRDSCVQCVFVCMYLVCCSCRCCFGDEARVIFFFLRN